MSTSGVLVILSGPTLRGDVDRVAAAAAVPVVHAADPASRKGWNAAAAVLVDESSALRCAAQGLPRRDRVILVGPAPLTEEHWHAAIAVGAHRVLTLPEQDSELVVLLSEAAESVHDDARRGAVVAVLAGRGGAGASVLATALALSAPEALLVDVDPWSGGLDLLLGAETATGLRWPDLTLRGGRIGYPALRDALPRQAGVTLLANGRSGGEIDPAALTAVVDAGSRGGATVVCDVPRRSTTAVEAALDAADLVIMVVTAEVRACAAASATAPWVSAVNPNVGLVVRGPAPGGLRASEVATSVGLPLLAAMRPQPGMAEALERGGLRIARRSPLAGAAHRVLTVLHRHPAEAAA